MRVDSKGVSRGIAILAVVIVIVLVSGAAYALDQSSQVGSKTTSLSTSTISSSLTLSTLSSVSSSSSNSTMSQLTVDEASSPGSTDPSSSLDNNGAELEQNTLLSLIYCSNSDCSQFIPGLSSSWTSTPNGLNYTFILRNNSYYSNGDPFNAYVVWWNIYRTLFMNQGPSFALYLYFNTSGVTVGDVNSLNNAQNSPTSNSTLLQVMSNPENSVSVLNSTAVQFHLTNPFVAFLQTVPCNCWVFVDPFTVEQHGGVVLNQPNTWMTVNATLNGDGPYVTSQFIPNQYAVLVSNPHYWAQDSTGLILQPAKIPEITINYKPDELTRTLDLQSDKSQASIVSFNDVNNTLSGHSNLYVPNTGLSGTPEFVGIDTQRSPTNNTLVRLAIIAAVNVSQIEQTVYNGYSIPFVGPTPRGMFFYNDSITPSQYNVTLAKSLLSEAGYPNGQGLPELNFVYPVSAYLSLAGQIIKQDLAQIGLTLNLQQVTYDEFLTLQAIPGTNSSSPYLSPNSWTYYPDFSAYEFIVDSQMGIFNYINNQTINNLISQSNDQVNNTLRAQEISNIAIDTQQQGAFIWLGQDLDLYDTGGGFGPTLWNICLTGMWYNSDFNGVAFNAVSYTCSPS